MNKFFRKTTRIAWIAVSAVVLAGCISYLILQQYYRRAADELPRQYARDVRQMLEQGNTPLQVLSAYGKQEMGQGPGVFVMVYGTDGQLIASAAVSRGAVLVLPPGVFKQAAKTGEYAVTWQPKPGLRNAMVILPFHSTLMGGYVAAGRSLQYTETSIRLVMLRLGASALCLIITIFGIRGISRYFSGQRTLNNSA